MSVGADSLMGHLDMNKLLDQETLLRGRAKRDGKNIQIKTLVDAMILSEPCLFNNSSDNLFPAKESEL
jgi:hypothetical protein